jgi:serine/threonine protein kinase
MAGGDQERLARILDDYLVAIERGLPITPEELLEKYPEDAAQLRGYLSGLQLFHAAAGVTPAQVQGSLTGGGIPQPMQALGDYRLVREIGRGGMGVVYQAWQSSLRRRVALKILPFTVARDAKQISRFKNEAQAAAQVQHPNIVPVYAVGEEHGIHYYVMQLVEGQSLTSLLDGLRMRGRASADNTSAKHRDYTLVQSRGRVSSTRGSESRRSSAACVDTPTNTMPMRAAETADHIRVVARLALQAAEALHAAHEYGVVHRDVKPSKLLLDDQGKLWVTDFGLARCREDQGLTQTGDVLGTMRYMSPEQALGRGALIDQRTDVYSLGITMYELATLHHPADEVSDIQIYFNRDRQGPKPLRHWNRHIPRDLQTIVLKCVAEFPHERYNSAKELADDLRRFLEGRPIEASPPSLLERASKWARRRRGVVYATAAVLLVAVVGAITAMTMIAREKAADQALALTQARESVRSMSEVLNLFTTDYAEQLKAIPGAEGVRLRMLEDGLDRYRKFESQAVNDPLLAGELALAYSSSGSLNEKIGDKKQARASYEKAKAVWVERLAREPGNFEYSRHLALCNNNLGLLMADGGNTAEGLALLTQARESQIALLADEPESKELSTNLATTHGNLGLVLRKTGANSEALKEFTAAINIQEWLAKLPEASENVLRSLASCYNSFASLQDDAHATAAADAYQKAIDIQLKLVKADSINRTHQSELARTYNNLGYLSSRLKDWAKAEVCYGNAIRLQEELVKALPLFPAYRRDLAISYNNIGMVQSRAARLAAAESSFQKAAQLQDMLLVAQPNEAETRSNQGSVWNNLASLLDRQQKLADAEQAYRSAIANQRRALEAVPTSERYRALLSQHYINLARNLAKQQKYDASIDAAFARKQLWPKQPERLYSVAQQLAATYGLMRASNAASQAQSACAAAAVATLREALAAGLPGERLKNASLANLATSSEYQTLIQETTAKISAQAASVSAPSAQSN